MSPYNNNNNFEEYSDNEEGGATLYDPGYDSDMEGETVVDNPGTPVIFHLSRSVTSPPPFFVPAQGDGSSRIQLDDADNPVNLHYDGDDETSDAESSTSEASSNNSEFPIRSGAGKAIEIPSTPKTESTANAMDDDYSDMRVLTIDQINFMRMEILDKLLDKVTAGVSNEIPGALDRHKAAIAELKKKLEYLNMVSDVLMLTDSDWE
ncbi:hypothetical protein GE09DRAFT_1218767 [Coniochaeta sp. 2T2.1]|nr:hypothetical protein GE09DRAFT_1218767 [Coniochaeta sp. 2T2.1]